MTDPNAYPSPEQARDGNPVNDDLAQPEYTDQTPPDQIAAAMTGNEPGQATAASDTDDTDGDDGPDEGAEQVDPENVPAAIRMPDSLHEGDEDKAGDELAGEDEDDSWLDEDEDQGGDQ